MTRLKTCLIGCGDIGYKFDRGVERKGALSHFKAITDSDKFDLCAIAELDKSIREEISSLTGIRAYEDYSEMLEAELPEVVVIASNDETHVQAILDSAELSPRLIFCEKPLGLSSEQISEVIEVCRNKAILLQVNYTRRFLDEFIRLGKEISGGSIGDIMTAVFYYSRGLIHNASHYLDLALWYFGTPDSVTMISSREGIENDRTYSFSLGYQCGREIIFAGLEPGRISFAEINFTGTKGMIRFNYNNEIEYYSVEANEKFKGYEKYELTGKEPVKFEQALPNAYENIYDAVVNGTELLSPGKFSEEIFQIINRVKEQEYV